MLGHYFIEHWVIVTLHLNLTQPNPSERVGKWGVKNTINSSTHREMNSALPSTPKPVGSIPQG